MITIIDNFYLVIFSKWDVEIDHIKRLITLTITISGFNCISIFDSLLLSPTCPGPLLHHISLPLCQYSKASFLDVFKTKKIDVEIILSSYNEELRLIHRLYQVFGQALCMGMLVWF